ncbi:MAG: hypothetical protein H6812_01170 [Phycisphaeraceae bacterium]|nr:hypothetical protein [Phycisphaerales bacterium]MCB9841845.1 hypothetical protein [Phycisphaeraceae bacterium]
MTTPRPTILTSRHRALIAAVRPANRAQLRQWLRIALEINLPRAPRMPDHQSPLDYLAHAFFANAHPRDCVVWACRGGGKTFYAAVATALDLIFKPGVEVRILGGSLEQSRRMHHHLRALFDKPALANLLDARPTERRLTLINKSSVEIMAQSHTSVRGSRPQILRCDEAELFDPDIWEAAQLTTRSKQCGDTFVRGAIEALSTHHTPTGLMSQLISDNARTQFRWSVTDVLEQCPPSRPCAPCPLEPDCAGAAKLGAGHITIDDAITLKSRTDEATWNAEMLCNAPRRTDAVYPEFNPDTHTITLDPPITDDLRWIAGMDFGLRNPTAILIACLDDCGVLRIIDEHIRADTRLADHIESIRASRWPQPAWIGVDPAGHQRSDQTGISPITLLRKHNLAIRARRSPVELGLRLVRARFKPAGGSPTLFIHQRCTGLIRSLSEYRLAPNGAPKKDGPDHAADALRYLVLNLDRPYANQFIKYA